MQTVTRWKIACMLFAAATAAQTLRDHRVARDIRSPEVQTHSSAIPLALRRPIRITAGALGISERDLIDRILAAKSLRDLQVLCEKLAAVGTDDSVEALGGMLADPRPGVPERILAAFAAIGTERAIDVVLNATSDERLLVKAAAIAALGASQSEKAERVLLEIASKAGDPMQDLRLIRPHARALAGGHHDDAQSRYGFGFCLVRHPIVTPASGCFTPVHLASAFSTDVIGVAGE